MSASPEISVVIPVYNEELNLPLLFSRLYPVMDALGRTYEVIFTNDRKRRPHRSTLLKEAVRGAPRCHPGHRFQCQLWSAHGDHGGV